MISNIMQKNQKQTFIKNILFSKIVEYLCSIITLYGLAMAGLRITKLDKLTKNE